MPRKAGPLTGMQYRFPSMADITRTQKERVVDRPTRSVGGSGHRAGRGAETAVTSGQQPGIVPGQAFPKVDQGGSNGTG